MDDLEKQWGTSSILSQALCIISNPWVNSNWSYSPETLNWGRNWSYFVPCDLEIWWMILENNSAPLLYYIKLCASFQIHGWSHSPETLNSGQNWWVFVSRDLEIWQMTLKNNRAPLLYYIKLCASFENHGSIQTGVTIRKCSIRVKSAVFCPAWHWNLTDDLENQ